MAVTMHLPPPMDVFPSPPLMAMSSRSHSRSSTSTSASGERERLAPPVSGAFYNHNYNYNYALQSQRNPSPSFPTFDIRTIQSLLRTTAPQAPPLQHVERLLASPHRVYLLRLANTAAAPLVLKSAPAPSTRMLRREATALAAEVAVLPLLTGAGLPVPTLISSNATTSSAAITNGTSASISASNTATTSQYLLRTHLPGTPLSYLSHPLPRHALTSINHALGTYLRRANALSSTSFGPASVVASGRGSSSWSVAFAIVGEGEEEAEEAFWNGLGVSKPKRGEPAYVRLLLYSVYRAVVEIVARHYRPQQEDEEEEMAELAARRALAKALGELAAL
ncbi:uncharacterized protein K452DRAFT_296039 [Aplosporella prunicola CBS 121167]|uniref:Aminoglycoside phosphotransferase domain-containing protein n=1 Tax=Aplosporella prunicola CBS 121167 TaxID=1176127 RepID=A0A6A6BMX7_9PEZI|nr:uncharacterized protein K452DRAFT_296039 [Aplosporella prunicola CBS 121167]KAF2144615.1 hypothetical protein K452DRAFT_296039 [Aplosporella prunicola CBS 121167]